MKSIVSEPSLSDLAETGVGCATQPGADGRDLPLTEGWLAQDAGFKFSQGERQTHKHWSLWIGWAANPGHACIDDLGIEVTMAWWRNRGGLIVGDPGAWNCWLKGMNRSFLHVRYIHTRGDLLAIIEALTGRPWNPELSRYGNLYTPEQAATLLSPGPAPGMNQNPPPSDIERT